MYMKGARRPLRTLMKGEKAEFTNDSTIIYPVIY